MCQIHDMRPRRLCLAIRVVRARAPRAGCTQRTNECGTTVCGAWPRLDGSLDDQLSVDDSAVVQVALHLWREHPCETPLNILDAALAGYRADDLEFEFDYDEFQPPHPFAELVRRAFAPDLDATELLLTTVDIEPRDPCLRNRIELAREAWHAALSRFADRYRLWAAPADGDVPS